MKNKYLKDNTIDMNSMLRDILNTNDNEIKITLQDYQIENIWELLPYIDNSQSEMENGKVVIVIDFDHLIENDNGKIRYGYLG